MYIFKESLGGGQAARVNTGFKEETPAERKEGTALRENTLDDWGEVYAHIHTHRHTHMHTDTLLAQTHTYTRVHAHKRTYMHKWYSVKRYTCIGKKIQLTIRYNFFLCQIHTNNTDL